MSNIIYHSVITSTKDGIVLASKNKKIFISFEQCSRNFSLEHGNRSVKCVATRDITSLEFTFYTQPKTKIAFRDNFLKKLILGKSATREFFDLQKAILKSGYTSYDIS